MPGPVLMVAEKSRPHQHSIPGLCNPLQANKPAHFIQPLVIPNVSALYPSHLSNRLIIVVNQDY